VGGDRTSTLPRRAGLARPFDPELAREEKVTVVVQVNGKLRDRFEADAGAAEGELKEAALGLERIAAAIAGRTVRKVICIGDKLVNIVVS